MPTRMSEWVVFCCALCVALAAGFARADLTDEMMKLPPLGQCQQKAMVFEAGLLARNSEFARKISHVDDATVHGWVEQGLVDDQGNPSAPKETMWVLGWDHLSDRDRALYESLAFLGWDKADKRISEELAQIRERDPEWTGEVNVYLSPGWVHATVNEFVELCLATTGGEHSDARFIKTASSDMPEADLRAKVMRLSYCIDSVPRWSGQCAEGSSYGECLRQINERLDACTAIKCRAITDEEMGLQ